MASTSPSPTFTLTRFFPCGDFEERAGHAEPADLDLIPHPQLLKRNRRAGRGQFGSRLRLKLEQSLLRRFGFDQLLLALDGIDRGLHFSPRATELLTEFSLEALLRFTFGLFQMSQLSLRSLFGLFRFTPGLDSPRQIVGQLPLGGLQIVQHRFHDPLIFMEPLPRLIEQSPVHP